EAAAGNPEVRAKRASKGRPHTIRGDPSRPAQARAPQDDGHRLGETWVPALAALGRDDTAIFARYQAGGYASRLSSDQRQSRGVQWVNTELAKRCRGLRIRDSSAARAAMLAISRFRAWPSAMCCAPRTRTRASAR